MSEWYYVALALYIAGGIPAAFRALEEMMEPPELTVVVIFWPFVMLFVGGLLLKDWLKHRRRESSPPPEGR
jgi:hypothetical protein